MRKLLFAMSAMTTAFAVSAATVDFTGASGGAYGDAANWTVEGGGNRLPGASDTAVVPADTEVLVANDADKAAFAATGKLKLDGATARVTVKDVAKALTACPLAGTGVFVGTNTASRSGIALTFAAVNTDFTGRFDFYGMRVDVATERGLGLSNRVDFVSTWDNSCVLRFKQPGHNYNDIRLKIVGYFYWTMAYDGTGDIFFHNRVTSSSSLVRIEAGTRSNSHIVFAEDCELQPKAGGQIDFNGRVRVLGKNRVYDGGSGTQAFYSDSAPLPAADGFFVERKIKGGLSVNKAGVKLGQADILDVDGTIAQCLVGTAGLPGQIDLNGFDQTFGTFSFGTFTLSASNNADYLHYPQPEQAYGLTSESAPATATFTKAPGGNNVQRATFDGKLSVTLDAENGTLSLSNSFPYAKSTATWGTERVPSTMSGTLWAKKGTINLREVRLPNVAVLRVGETGSTVAAKLAVVSSVAEVNPTAKLEIEGVGELNLASGVTLTVLFATKDGDYLPTGTYGAGGQPLPGGVTGEGTLVITYAPSETVKLYVGGSGALSTEADAWIPSGKPADGSELVFVETDVDVTEAQYADFINKMSSVYMVGSSLTVNGATGALAHNVALRGTGSFAVLSSVDNVDKKFKFMSDNSAFGGTLAVSNYFVEVHNAKAFGKSSKVVIWGPSIAGQKGYALSYRAGGVFENELDVHNGNSWWTVVADGVAVTNKGAFVYTALNSGLLTRIQSSGGAKGYLAFQGPITGMCGKLLLGGNVELSGEDPIVLSHTKSDYGRLYCDNWESDIYYDKKIAERTVDSTTKGGVLLLAYGTWHLMSDRNVLKDARIVLGSVSAKTTLDLHGHDTTIGHFSNGWESDYGVGQAVNADFTITSEKPAKATFTSICSARAGWGAKINGAVSLGIDMHDYGCYDGTWMLTLTNAADSASTTTGSLEPNNGTFRLTSTTRLPNITAIRIGALGNIWAQGTPKLNRKVELFFPVAVKKSVGNSSNWNGVLAINEGESVTVKQAYTNGVALPPGEYTMANLPYVKGGSASATKSGTLRVRGGGLTIMVR